MFRSDYPAANAPQGETATCAVAPRQMREFSEWMDEQLRQLELRHQSFWTRHSVLGSLDRKTRG